MIKEYASVISGDLMSEWKYMLIFIVPLIFILVLMDIQYTNIGFLQLHSMDEYAFYGSLVHMYQGFLSKSATGLFSFGFYAYGFAFFLINLIIAIPSFLSHTSSGAIIGARFVTSVFAISSLIYIYKFARIYVDKFAALLTVGLIVATPGFWLNATWFHPDWMMTFFVFAALYYFAKDNGAFSRWFWVGVGLFGAGVGVKYQALMFLPLVLSYVFYDEIRSFNLSHFVDHAKKAIGSICTILTIFVLFNPYIIHPLGFRVWYSWFARGMDTNAGNMVGVQVFSLGEKLSKMIDIYYMPIALFFVLTVLVIVIGVKGYTSRKRGIAIPIALTFLISASYLLFGVNQLMQHYYFPVIYLGILCIPLAITGLSRTKQIVIMVAIVGTLSLCNYSRFVHSMSLSRDGNTMYTVDQSRTINSFIIQSFVGNISSSTAILISSGLPLEYERLGLQFDNIQIIYGPLRDELINKDAFINSKSGYTKGDEANKKIIEKLFTPKEYIVLRKNEVYVNKENINYEGDKSSFIKSRDLFENLLNGSLGYRLAAENEFILIFKKK